jgi:hypothetical protein
MFSVAKIDLPLTPADSQATRPLQRLLLLLAPDTLAAARDFFAR